MAFEGKEKLTVLALGFLVAVCALTLRTAYISADPPHGLSVSKGIYTDEGLKYYSARNRAVFGQWRVKVPDAVQGPLKPSPVPSAVGAAVFRIFGTGRVQARMISAVSGVLSCLILVLIGARNSQPREGLLAGAFAAVNFAMVSYDRLALFESPAVMLSLCAALFYLEGGKRRLVLTPVFLILAYFTRASMIAVAGALAALLVTENWRRLPGTPRKRTLVALGAFVLVAAAGALVLVLPENQIAAQIRARFGGGYFAAYPILPGALDLAARTFSDSVLSAWTPLTLVLALFAIAHAAAGADACEDRRPAVLLAWWFAASMALVAFLDYRPTRYFVLMIPAISYLAAYEVVTILRGASVTDLAGGRRVAWMVLRFIAGVLIASVALRFVVERRHEVGPLFGFASEALWRMQTFVESNFIGSTLALKSPPSAAAVGLMWIRILNLSILSIAIAALGLGLVVLRRSLVRGGNFKRLRLVVATLLVALVMMAQVGQFVSFASHRNRRHEVASVERAVGEIVGRRSDACIGGNWAPTICMGTPYFTFPLAKGNGNAWDTFKRFPVTHLLMDLGSEDEIGYMRRTYPQEMAQMKRLGVFRIDFFDVGLFEYAPSPGAAPPWPFDERKPE